MSQRKIKHDRCSLPREIESSAILFKVRERTLNIFRNEQYGSEDPDLFLKDYFCEFATVSGDRFDPGYSADPEDNSVSKISSCVLRKDGLIVFYQTLSHDSPYEVWDVEIPSEFSLRLAAVRGSTEFIIPVEDRRISERAE